MIVMDIMDVLEDLCEDQREFILKALIDQFSEVSSIFFTSLSLSGMGLCHLNSL